MKIKRSSKPPTLTRAGKVAMKVSKIVLRDFCFLNSLNIRAILSDRIIVVDEPP